MDLLSPLQVPAVRCLSRSAWNLHRTKSRGSGAALRRPNYPRSRGCGSARPEAFRRQRLLAETDIGEASTSEEPLSPLAGRRRVFLPMVRGTGLSPFRRTAADLHSQVDHPLDW